MSKINALELLLLEGEGLKAEFKEKLKNLDREIVAMANAAGGSIFLGINDDNKITGIKITNELKSQITDIARNCDPNIEIVLIAHHKEKVLEIQIPESADKPHRCQSGFFLRVGPNTQKLKRNEIIHFINETTRVRFDEATNKHFIFPKDFSKETFSHYLQLCDIHSNAPTKDLLISLNIADESLSFTNAGVLFFSKKPQQFFPESYITAVTYKTADRFSIIDRKDFNGSLIDQIKDSLSFIMKHTSVELQIQLSRTDTSGRHLDVYDYPILALREAIINAVTHRDYQYDSSHIYIHIYPDYIDIENPGGLYRGLTIESLGKRSVRRNRLIADLLCRAKFIERVGSGFDRMRRALIDNNNPELQVEATNFFNIRFHKRVRQPSILKLTARQQHLYQLIEERSFISKREASTLLKVSEDTALRDLHALIKQNLVDKIGKGKATTYVLTKT